MKTVREAPPMLRHEPVFAGALNDSYRIDRKLAGTVRCRLCGASWARGRWTWKPAPEGAREDTCPACRRLQDDYPGGFLTLQGPFFDEHRDAVLAVVRGRETHEKAEHPLQRIMAVRDAGDHVLVTTTDPHLARVVVEALKSAFKGVAKLSYAKRENRLQASWTR